MTPAMEKLMNELAEKSINRNMYELHEADARVRQFKLGFGAAIAHVSKDVEFNEIELNEYLKACAVSPSRESGILFIKGARWQFDQCAARIGMAEQSREMAIQDLNACIHLNKELTARAEKAEDLLREFIEWSDGVGIVVEYKGRTPPDIGKMQSFIERSRKVLGGGE